MLDSPFHLIAGGDYRCTPTWNRAQPGYDDYHRFYFCRRGRAELILPAGVVPLVGGRIYFIPGYRPIGYRCARSLTLFWLHFRADDPAINALLAGQAQPQSWPTGHWSHWHSTYRQLAHYFALPRRELALRLQAMLLRAAADILGSSLDQPQADPAAALRRQLAPALAFMDEHYRANPPLAQIARQAHLCPSHFHRLFRQLYALSPHQYMLRARMQLAHQLLRQGQHKVSAVAQSAGYANVFYFSRVFTRFFGHNPRQVRQGRIVPRP